jgi:hypothetical protein
MNEIDTANEFMVACQGDKVVIMNPPRGLLSQDEALVLAAWLVALSFAERSRFDEVLNAVENT